MARDPSSWQRPPRWIPGSADPFRAPEFAFNLRDVIPDLPEFFDSGDTVTFQAEFTGAGVTQDVTFEFDSLPGADEWWSEYFRVLRDRWREFLQGIGYPPRKSPDDAQPVLLSVERNNETLQFGRARPTD